MGGAIVARLADSMARSVEGPALASQLGRRAREHAASFSRERCARENRDVYGRVVGERNGRAR
jgi:hypothetical protein